MGTLVGQTSWNAERDTKLYINSRGSRHACFLSSLLVFFMFFHVFFTVCLPVVLPGVSKSQSLSVPVHRRSFATVCVALLQVSRQFECWWPWKELIDGTCVLSSVEVSGDA